MYGATKWVAEHGARFRSTANARGGGNSVGGNAAAISLMAKTKRARHPLYGDDVA